MDDQSNIQQTSEPVGFPSHSPAPAKRGIGKWVVFIVLLLVILGGGVFFLLRSSNEAIEAPTATPNIRGVETIYTPAPEDAKSTPTPAAFDKAGAKVQVLNGTGTAGDAGLAKTALTGIGFTQVDTGNAPSQTATTTTVTVDSSVPESARTEIKTTLEKTFQTVNVSSGTVSGGYTIQVTTGTKKSGSAGSTSAAARASATPRASGSPRPSASASPRPSATP